jgi:hypothetical protein
MSPSHELSALFAAERAAQPPAAAAQQGWARLAADLAANVAPLPVAVGPLKLGLWLVPKWILAGFALGLLGAGATAPWLAPHRTESRPRRPAVVVVTSQSGALRTTLPAESQPVLAPSLPSSPPGVELEPARPALSPSALSSAPASASSAATFDAELKLITLAKSELDAHRPAQARAWLSEHAARFPNGVFVTERDALNALATCEQGPRNESLANAFAARHPSSPLVERVTKACRVALPAGSSLASPQASASFATLPNDSGLPGEPITEPSGGKHEIRGN